MNFPEMKLDFIIKGYERENIYFGCKKFSRSRLSTTFDVRLVPVTNID